MTIQYKRLFLLLVFVLSVFAFSSEEHEPLSKAAIELLQTQAEAGNAKAQVALGRAYQDGNGVSQSDEQAVKWYRIAASRGDAAGQNSLGVMYHSGHGVEQDKAEALKWYAAAANQGYADALFNVGVCYFNGDGISIDDLRAYAFFSIAEQAGSLPAVEAVRRMQAKLTPWELGQAKVQTAALYRQLKDTAHALEIYRRLADANNPEAQVLLAKMYLDGEGLQQDPAAAFHLFERASTSHYPEADLYLGQMYEAGQGVAPDLKKAFESYQRGAAESSPMAMYGLAKMYAEGRGTKADRVMAYVWLRRAVRFRYHPNEVDELMEKLKGEMSERELKDAARVPDNPMFLLKAH